MIKDVIYGSDIGALASCSLLLLFSLPGNAADVSKVNHYIYLVNALIRDASNRDLWFVDDWPSEIHLKNRMETEKGKGKKKPQGVGELAAW